MSDMNKEDNITLTLDPEQLAKYDDIPVMEPVVLKQEEKSVSIVDENLLSEAEKKQVAEFSKNINILDSKQVMLYGSTAQKDISDFSVTILNKVKTRDLGEIGDSLKSLTVALNATTKEEKKGLAGLFSKPKNKIENIKMNYDKAETNVKKIEKDLESHQIILTQDISMFEQMYDLNLKYYKELTMYIAAGEKALSQAREETLPALKAQAEASGSQEAVEKYNDTSSAVNRFEKKLHDLELTRMISLQIAPQIRMLQTNDEELLSKLQSSLVNTIPLWRNQMVLSLGLEHTHKALEAQNAVSSMTNELLKKNAQMLKQSTVETAKEAERAIVDVEVLKQCNQDLISSITEVMQIHEDGIRQRQEAKQELVQMENELKQALIEASNR